MPRGSFLIFRFKVIKRPHSLSRSLTHDMKWNIFYRIFSIPLFIIKILKYIRNLSFLFWNELKKKKIKNHPPWEHMYMYRCSQGLSIFPIFAWSGISFFVFVFCSCVLDCFKEFLTRCCDIFMIWLCVNRWCTLILDFYIFVLLCFYCSMFSFPIIIPV